MYELQHELLMNFRNVAFEEVIGDIRSKERLERVFTHYKPQVVFHAAAYKHVPLMEDNPSEAVLTNIKGTKHLVDLCDAFNVEKMVMISTDKAVNPTNVMGASKRIAEMYAQSANQHSNTQFITTRFGNVLGSNGSVIPLFQKQITQGGPITLTDERITRFFMTIPEACQLVLEAGAMGEGGEIFVFDMGESVKIIDLAKKMIKIAKNCGVDAVKFQSWTPDSLISKEEYEKNQVYNDGDGGKKHFGSLKQMVEKYYLREEQHFLLKSYCDNLSIDFCSSIFFNWVSVRIIFILYKY
jgi:FlaA1/EpsC-like NDP-sugar epimerase